MAVGVARTPAHVDTQVAAVVPARFLQPLNEAREAGLPFRILGGPALKHADPPHPVGLLRLRWERPRRSRTAEQCDELASPHSITSSARASNLSGIGRRSAFAALRLIT